MFNAECSAAFRKWFAGSNRESGNHVCDRFCACSSVGQSSGFLIRGSRVRITPGAPILLLGAFCLSLLPLVAGCAAYKPRSAIASAPQPPTSNFTWKTSETAPPKPPTETTLTLVSLASARITIVRPEEKFVVIDFSSRTMPALGTTLTVYRTGQKIGVVQLNGPTRALAAVADIIDGEIQPGDEVR